jgi:hypothetical protein
MPLAFSDHREVVFRIEVALLHEGDWQCINP